MITAFTRIVILMIPIDEHGVQAGEGGLETPCTILFGLLASIGLGHGYGHTALLACTRRTGDRVGFLSELQIAL